MKAMKSTQPLYFQLNPYCFVVRADKDVSLYDLSRSICKNIPESMAMILTDLIDRSLSDVLDIAGEENYGVIAKHYNYLMKNDFGTFVRKRPGARNQAA